MNTNKIPVKVTITTEETVTISRSEYNKLIIAKAQIDMILATADNNGYGCTEIVKGARSLDEYSKAVADAEKRYSELAKERDEAVDNFTKEVITLKEELKKALATEPESMLADDGHGVGPAMDGGRI